MNRTLPILIQVERKLFRQHGTHIPASGEYFADSFDQLIRRTLLFEVAGRTSLKDPPAVLLFGMHAQHQNGELGSYPFEFAEDLKAASSRHREVEKQEVPFLVPDARENLLSIRRSHPPVRA